MDDFQHWDYLWKEWKAFMDEQAKDKNGSVQGTLRNSNDEMHGNDLIEGGAMVLMASPDELQERS